MVALTNPSRQKRITNKKMYVKAFIMNARTNTNTNTNKKKNMR